MQDLPAEVARTIENMKVGEVSTPFEMVSDRGKTVCAIVRLKNRIEGHKATVTEDFQVLKNMLLEKKRQERINSWVADKIKTTYVWINDRYKNCDFEYQGWIK